MSDKDHIWELGYTQNRELSWLKFNERRTRRCRCWSG